MSNSYNNIAKKIEKLNIINFIVYKYFALSKISVKLISLALLDIL